MEDRKTGKNTKKWICMAAAVGIALFLTGLLAGERTRMVQAKVAKTQESLAEEVFRFHVLGNSDSRKDQEVKLKVRDAVIDYMKRDMGEWEDVSGGEDAAKAEATKRWAKTHLRKIEDTANQVLEEEGYSYRAKAEVTTCYFPDKRYGDVLFPKGEYEALRIKLGKAKGRNWWCVLYPNLCFMNSTCAVVEEDGKKVLKEALTAEEYEMVTAASDFKIKWFFFGDKEKDEKIHGGNQK